MEDKKQDNPFGKVIYSYTRNDGLEDGFFADISELAKEAGFKIPVCVTQGVLDLLNEKLEGQDLKGRAWDMFTILKLEIKRQTKPDSFIEFKPVFIRVEDPQTYYPKPVKLWATIEDTGDGSPGMTIMLPEEY